MMRYDLVMKSYLFLKNFGRQKAAFSVISCFDFSFYMILRGEILLFINLRLLSIEHNRTFVDVDGKPQ